jgi:hypothetical protein
MPNLQLLAQIAEGERSFGVAPNASAEEQAAFDQLVCDVRHLTALGYTGELRPLWHADDDGHRWRSLEVLSPGITTAGTAALRRAGLDVSGEFAVPVPSGARGAGLEASFR